jgi:DNA (cytosine-5)-methyltransferase 1
VSETAAFTFVDLFAGIGGFHAALAGMGGECVYAVEIDEQAAQVYEHNWGMSPLGDITRDANDDVMVVPPHDVLVAGFPCQPFSKSGAQLGMEETRGTLYWNILRIIQVRRPAVVLLENVRNLAGPRHRHEWAVIIETLREEGYRVSSTPAVFSPHLLPRSLGGRPQVRDRVFIAATLDPRASTWTSLERQVLLEAPPVVDRRVRVDGFDPQTWNLERDLPLDPEVRIPGTALSLDEQAWIKAWDDWVVQMWERVGVGGRLPGFPVWVDEWRSTSELERHIRQGRHRDTPAWKLNFLRKNAELFTKHRDICEPWMKKSGVLYFPPSRRKLEWQAQDTPTLWQTLMHFRPSGIRAKRMTYVPALVAITQTSIVGEKRRRISPREAARLQGLPDTFSFGDQPASATYKQLGNGVNVGVVWYVMKRLVDRDADLLGRTERGRALMEAVRMADDAPDQAVELALESVKKTLAERELETSTSALVVGG